MSQSLVVVDAFTDRPFAGNPAAVCVLEKPADEVWMAAVAREMNLSETAFLHPENDGYRLRWLTPVAEVKLCGHATLASAHVLWESRRRAPEADLHFYTHSGRLTARRSDGRIRLDFPRREPVAAEAPAGLAQALGAEMVAVYRVAEDLLVELVSAEAVRGLAPDVSALSRAAPRGVIVTARSDEPRFDFVSRFFAPAVGIPEDPVTGAAHTGLAPFWAARLGKTALVGYQASARGGVVAVDVGPEVGADRVVLAGQAVTVSRVELLFPPP